MIKLADIDLNLLVVFDLLYQEQNTQRVALRLGITQPAVSHALKRLRLLLNDELFERTSQGLQPTPRASPAISHATSASRNDTRPPAACGKRETLAIQRSTGRTFSTSVADG